MVMKKKMCHEAVRTRITGPYAWIIQGEPFFSRPILGARNSSRRTSEVLGSLETGCSSVVHVLPTDTLIIAGFTSL